MNDYQKLATQLARAAAARDTARDRLTHAEAELAAAEAALQDALRPKQQRRTVTTSNGVGMVHA